MVSTSSALVGTTRNDGGAWSWVRVSSTLGWSANSSFISEKAAAWSTNLKLFTPGWLLSWVRTASTWLSLESAFMKIDSSTPPRQRAVCLLTAWRSSSAPPKNASDKATVRMAASVMSRLRRRLVAVSLTTYPAEMATLGKRSVDAAGLVAHDDAAVEFDDTAAHLVDDALVVRGHDDCRAGAVDAIEEAHDADGRVGIEVAGGLVGQQDQRPVDEGPGDRHAL